MFGKAPKKPGKPSPFSWKRISGNVKSAYSKSTKNYHKMK